MTDLAGKRAIIAGGTGTVGEGIVRAFLRAGAHVIVPSRSQDSLARLIELLAGEQLDRLSTILGNIGDEADAARMRDKILSDDGPVDAVVASLGGTWEEKLKLVDVPASTWKTYADSNLSSHFIAAKTWLPMLAHRSGSSYTLLGGISAVLPIPQYGIVSANSAAQLMMARTLMEEMKETLVRINEVIFGYINTRARAAYARPEWITADEVGRFCAYLASDEASMINGGVIQLGNRPPTSTS